MIIRCFCGRAIGDAKLNDHGLWIKPGKVVPGRLPIVLSREFYDPGSETVVVTSTWYGAGPAGGEDGEFALVCFRHGAVPVRYDELVRALRHGRKTWQVTEASRKVRYESKVAPLGAPKDESDQAGKPDEPPDGWDGWWWVDPRVWRNIGQRTDT